MNEFKTEAERLQVVSTLAHACQQISAALVDVSNIATLYPEFFKEHYKFIPSQATKDGYEYGLIDWSLARVQSEAHFSSHKVLFGEERMITWKGTDDLLPL